MKPLPHYSTHRAPLARAIPPGMRFETGRFLGGAYRAVEVQAGQTHLPCRLNWAESLDPGAGISLVIPFAFLRELIQA